MFKKLFFVLFIVSLSSYATKPHVTSVKADTEKSYVYWRGNELGGFHDGNIKLKSGYIISDHGKLVGGKFIIDMNTMVAIAIIINKLMITQNIMNMVTNTKTITNLLIINKIIKYLI